MGSGAGTNPEQTVSRRLILRPEAEAEMADAFEWYEECVPGLGGEFLLCVDAVFNSILRNPLQFPVFTELPDAPSRAVFRTRSSLSRTMSVWLCCRSSMPNGTRRAGRNEHKKFRTRQSNLVRVPLAG